MERKMTEKLYCEDCKWFRRDWVFFLDKKMAKCASPETAVPTGLSPSLYDRRVARKYDKSKMKKIRQYCSSARISPCGEDAKYWEGK